MNRLTVRHRFKVQGSVLLVCLVLLLILTIAGMASIRITSLEEKMTGNYRNEQLAFHSAEVGVQEAEWLVENTRLITTEFTPDCLNGLCFDGSNADDPGTCTVNATSPWEEEALWNDAQRHKITTIALEGIPTQAKYIVEFRCYLPRDSDGLIPDPTDFNDWAGFYRITVLASGGSDEARVMIQTTYKKEH